MRGREREACNDVVDFFVLKRARQQNGWAMIQLVEMVVLIAI